MDVNFSLGLIEVKALGHAILILDDMLKAGEVEFVATERRLGGWLVSLIVKGEDLSAVQAAVDAGVKRAKELNCLKVHEVIARPHPEILKFLNLDDTAEEKANSESAATHVGMVNAESALETGKKPAPKAEAPKPVRRRRTKKAAPATTESKA